jgi:FkbM family methyltransferase
MRWTRRLAARLPKRVQLELKRVKFQRQIRLERFVPHEPEMQEISRLLMPGDWAVDIGANVGHYTCHLASCVGPTGRVLAFEPILETFQLLAANVYAAGYRNVTLVNAASSVKTCVAHMTVPKFEDTGLDNLYWARLSNEGEHPVLCFPLDSMPIPQRVRLVKIDAEGHDMDVLKGMASVIERWRPVLIVESRETGEIADWVRAAGYSVRKYSESANIIAEPL